MKKSTLAFASAAVFSLIGCNQSENLNGSLNVETSKQPLALSTSSQFHYIDWQSANPAGGTASGTITLGDGSTVGVTFEVINPDGSASSFYGAQTSGGTNFWIPNAPYLSADVPNSPPDADIIQLQGGTSSRYIITFSQPVKDPIMPVGSLGQRGKPTFYVFDREFEVVSQGVGYHGSGPFYAVPGSDNKTLRGEEGHGTIRFIGTFSVLTWTVPSPETWHGITLGIRTTTAIEPDVCPAGYEDGAPFESFTVNANGTTSPVFNPPSLTPLIAGRPYIAKATGTYSFHIFRSDTWGDAGYRTGDNWATQDGPNPLFGLAIDGVIPNWGSYNAGHEYKTIFYGTGGAQGFRILDDAYGDNSGSLNVTLSTCEPTSLPPTPTTTTVSFGAGPFVYNGSAFTATASVSPAEAGAATITYSGDCTNAGGTCTATATFAGAAGYDPSSASASITIEKAPTTTSVSFGSGPFVYTGSAFTATASVSPAAAGSATISYSGDCVNAGSSCTATATFTGSGNYLPSSASAGITIEKAPTTTSVSFGTGPFIYTGSAFTAAASVSPATAGSATIAYSGDCVYAGNTCTATATYAGSGNFLPSDASTGIVIQYPVATNADMCKKGGWQFATDDLGNLFKNQGDCVSYVSTKGKNKGAGR